jgi:hypothetical protein
MTPVRALDVCYMDDQSIRFNIKDSINLCVTVIAYASQAHRTTQMLFILDIIVPRYLVHLKQETQRLMSDSKSGASSSSSVGKTAASPLRGAGYSHQDIVQYAKQELTCIQKVATSLKTLLNISDFMTRFYVGPSKAETTTGAQSVAAGGPTSIAAATNQSGVTNLQKSTGVNRSPSIMQDEDSAAK